MSLRQKIPSAGKPQSRPKVKGSAVKGMPKKPISLQERLKRLFTSLSAQIDGGHFNNAVKTCDKVLRLQPNDPDALKTKMFLLLQTEQYEASLSLIDQSNQCSPHHFERAYSLYRLHREVEAEEVLKVIRAQKGEDRGALHLEAQLNYREGSYQAAVDLYSQLLDSAEPGSEEYPDILTNLQASQQHLDFINKGFLQALDALPSKISTNIEFAPPPAAVSSAVFAHASTSATDNLNSEKNSAVPPVKKVRASRVPAGVVPGVTPPPDPERWLKKSERSTFGQGRRRKGGGGATQGSTNVDSAPPPTGGSGPSSKSSGGKGKKKK